MMFCVVLSAMMFCVVLSAMMFCVVLSAMMFCVVLSPMMFCAQTILGWSLLFFCFLGGSCFLFRRRFMFCYVRLYLFKHTGVQHDFYIR